MLRRLILWGTPVLAVFAAGFFVWQSQASEVEMQPIVEEVQVPQEPKDTRVVKNVEVVSGSTFGVLMEEAGLGDSTATAMYNAAHELYDLARIRVGRTIVLTFDEQGIDVEQLKYQTDSENELFIKKDEDGSWYAELLPIEYEVRIKTAEGTITDSLYAAALAQGIDDATIVGFAEVFQWTLDFAMDLRQGDSFKFIYEERWRDGEYVMPGTILAGKFTNAGNDFYGFHWEHDDGTWAHYDQDGNNVQKMFLKAPLSFKYISSGFTTGRRYVAAFNVSTGHRAIDYAAATGTPIRAVGDGTVVRAGWNGPYGRFVSIRHNGTYTTNYAHMSRIAVSYGQRVKQSQVIGYVGSTGFSTGPHLHYEMVKHGVKINPLREILPPGEPIDAQDKEAFLQTVQEYRAQLDS